MFMLKILIVEDSQEKAKKIFNVCKRHVDAGSEIEILPSVELALKHMQKHETDLLLLDIQLPFRYGEKAKIDGGITLLKRMFESDKYLKPDHVIGITQYDSTISQFEVFFKEYLIWLIFYDKRSTEWEVLLQKKLSYLESVRAIGEIDIGQYGVDVAILTALNDPELDAVLRLPFDWQRKRIVGDHQLYYAGVMMTEKGRDVTVICASSDMMGMPAASALAMKMCIQFKPRLLTMCGIMAGIRGEVHIGDVIVSDPVWDYGSGKWAIEDNEKTFLPAPNQLRLDSSLRANALEMNADVPELQRIISLWPAGKTEHGLSVKIGPVGSGAAVLASDEAVNEVKKQHRKLTGIEMEAYGVFLACDFAPEPKPKALVIKGVSDYADEHKDDSYRQYAAYVSAQILSKILEKNFN
jgi:nucleoside phosphorylase/CheY-like chemotaxis protein